jgi:hypothetical protein
MSIKYRTKDGRADYEFSFEQQSDGQWRAYIVSQPSYGNRGTGLMATHRLKDGRRYYVCWTKPLWTQSDLKKVVSLWADLTQRYIAYGTAIEKP